MRISGGYTLHHSLTAEAAATVKQAVSLARRRGHAQVSPLHVASAMLSTPGGLLKRACLQSHSHPLQCKALELCFNVALNRLPTSAPSGPLLGHHHHLPSLSNALVAAFKRAQAHQRRGSIENQQQPILALKVEVEQLVVSVLDDPSVSRVMREAGFSSTHVKSNVEHSISADKSAVKISSPPPLAAAPPPPPANLSQFRRRPVLLNEDGDVAAVLDAMLSEKTRNAVVVGESAAGGEALVKKVMARFDGGGGGVPEGMESVRFISVPLSTLKSVGREEFEVKVGELRSLVRSYVGRGVVLYLGDLGWVADFWCRHGGGERNSPVEYMIMELSRLVSGDAYNNRLWLMGVATFETYENCRSSSGGGRRPSLESLWSLHPLALPLKTLALGLSLHSGMHGEVKKEVLEDSKWMQGIKKELVCCWDCTDNFKREAESIMNVEEEDGEEFVSSSSKLPSWLQQYKDDQKRKQLTVNTQESEKIKQLSKKWNSICTSLHKKPHFLEKVFNLSSSSSPSSSASASASDHLNKTHTHQDLLNWPTILDRDAEVSKPSSPSAKPELLSNPNSSPNSASSSEASGDLRPPHTLYDLIPDNLTAALEEKVPWQRHAAAEVAAAVLKCRSGGMRGEGRRESWLGFTGPDRRGKEAMAREVARVVFGSDDDFIAVGISSFSPEEKSDDEVASRRKRGRNEEGGSVYDRFVEAVRDNPSRLIFVEDVEEIDRGCVKKFERVMRDGEVGGDEGEALPLKDAIVVFCCEEREGERERDGEEKEEEECGPLDLNVVMEEGNIPVSGILDSVDMQVVFRIQAL